MLGLLALAISQTGFPNSCLSSATISHVAVAVRAINGTEGKSDGSLFRWSNAGLYRTKRGTCTCY